MCGEAGGLAEWWVLANYWESCEATRVLECKNLLGARVDFEGCVALCVCAMALVSMDQIVPNT